MKTPSIFLKTGLILFLLVVGATYLFAWTNPAGVPPTANVSAPLNVGSLFQTKTGGLKVGTDFSSLSLWSVGSSVFNGKVAIVDGTQGQGKVLTSDANGISGWTSTSSLGISNGGNSLDLKLVYCNTLACKSTTAWACPTGYSEVGNWSDRAPTEYNYFWKLCAANLVSLNPTPGYCIWGSGSTAKKYTEGISCVNEVQHPIGLLVYYWDTYTCSGTSWVYVQSDRTNQLLGAFPPAGKIVCGM